jgi:hypothetical protein
MLASAGKRWGFRAARESDRRYSSAMWLEVMMLPSGSWMLWPDVVAILSTHGLSLFKKWPVQPMSVKA